METASHTEFESGLVSIITPTFNEARYLTETISSVMGQTYKNWEWVIADDGSTDGTVEIVEKAAKKEHRIHFISPDGKTGLAARARNRAMKHARGEFFAFLDADDLWAPGKTERQTEYLRQHPEADAVCCWHDLFGDQDRVMLESRMMNYQVYAGRVCDRSDFIKELPFQTSTVMMRRRCYERIGGMDEDPRLRSGQDAEYFARLIASCNVHRLQEVLAHYRVAAPGSSLKRNNLTPQNSAAWNVFEVMLQKGFYTREEVRRKRSSLYYDQAINNLFHFDGPYRRYLMKSLVSGRPPLRAIVTLSLSFLTRPLLKRTLVRMLSAVNRWNLRNTDKE
jgi:glycosyltransferase involved in cell wall biosynthesis